MHHKNKKIAPVVFLAKFLKHSHLYPTKFFSPLVRSSQLPNFIKLSTRFKLADVTFETNL